MKPVHGIILADEHGGHLFGLTPPAFQLTPSQTSASRLKSKAYDWQRYTWEWFETEFNKAIDLHGPFDRLVNNGDALEGKGERSGSTELLTAARDEQCAITEATIRHVAAPRVSIIRGTPSHTGTDEDWEDVLAKSLGVQAQDHAWLEVGNEILDFKHHIGSSAVPGAIPPALTREGVWNLMWAEKELVPRATYIFRSHLHKFFVSGDEDVTCIVTPALQGWTKYGSRRMSKTISFGFITTYLDEDGNFSWTRHIMVPTFAKSLPEPM